MRKPIIQVSEETLGEMACQIEEEVDIPVHLRYMLPVKQTNPSAAAKIFKIPHRPESVTNIEIVRECDISMPVIVRHRWGRHLLFDLQFQGLCDHGKEDRDREPDDDGTRAWSLVIDPHKKTFFIYEECSDEECMAHSAHIRVIMAEAEFEETAMPDDKPESVPVTYKRTAKK